LYRIISYRFALLLLACFWLVGCCGDNNLNNNTSLSSAWLPYNAQQNILFEGENKEIISFTTTKRLRNQQATDKVCGAYFIQTEDITLTPSSDPDVQLIFSFSHEIVLDLKVVNIKTNQVGLEAKFNTVAENYITHAWRDTYAKEGSVNGQNFYQLLQVFGNEISSKLEIAEILYARGSGLVAFRTFTGGWYYIQ